MPLLEWHIRPTPEFIRTTQTYEKKHPDELAATLANLQERYLPRLRHARHPGLVHAGCLHHEGRGIIAIPAWPRTTPSRNPTLRLPGRPDTHPPPPTDCR